MATVNEILEATRFGVLATTTPDNTPWSVPVGFVYDEGCIYFRSSPDAIHSKNIETNPSIAFTILDTTQSAKGAVYIHSTAQMLSGQEKEYASNLLDLRFKSPPAQWDTVCYFKISKGSIDSKKSIESMYYFRSIQNES